MLKQNLNQYLISFLIIGSAFSLSFFVLASSKEDIVFPVEELRNCKNEAECRAFCDKPENIELCISFAEKHNLMSEEELEKAKAFLRAGEGPGDCKNQNECEAFCESPNNMDICLDFAEKNNLMTSDELKEARLVAKALREGASLPGGCRNKAECESYCDEPSHINECLDFAEKAGFISPDELQEARKAAQAMSQGIKPPGNCRGKKQCEQYCFEPSHMEECLNFAEAAGFISPEEVAEARRIMPLMLTGEMPGGCKNKEECEAYCENEVNLEECANFALKAGLMKPEEYEMFKKIGGKGPGGCKDREECEDFCNNPANQEVCFNFAAEHGLIPEEEIEKMKEGMRMMPFEERERPENTMPPSGARPPIEFRGPGGCASPEECINYCQDPAHLEECRNFIQGPMPSPSPTQEVLPFILNAVKGFLTD